MRIRGVVQYAITNDEIFVIGEGTLFIKFFDSSRVLEIESKLMVLIKLEQSINEWGHRRALTEQNQSAEQNGENDDRREPPFFALHEIRENFFQSRKQFDLDHFFLLPIMMKNPPS